VGELGQWEGSDRDGMSCVDNSGNLDMLIISRQHGAALVRGAHLPSNKYI
jgi:hypothetical protein